MIIRKNEEYYDCIIQDNLQVAPLELHYLEIYVREFDLKDRPYGAVKLDRIIKLFTYDFFGNQGKNALVLFI